MKPSPRIVALALGAASLMAPAGLAADEDRMPSRLEEEGEDDVPNGDEETPPNGLFFTNSCDDQVNLEAIREMEAAFFEFQLLVSCWNARHNLVEVCPWMFPHTSTLLANGPDRWFKRVYEAEFKLQTTPEGVIEENRRVITGIEARVKRAFTACLAEEHEGKALRRCQRKRMKNGE